MNTTDRKDKTLDAGAAESERKGLAEEGHGGLHKMMENCCCGPKVAKIIAAMTKSDDKDKDTAQ